MLEEKLKQIFKDAIDLASGDVHIMPEKGHYAVHFRVSNRLHKHQDLEESQALMMISHLKYLANMDVGEKRRPQSGALDYPLGDRDISLRLSTITDYKGFESIVIRILGQSFDIDLRKNTFYSDDIDVLESLLNYQSGFVIFSGPVSSGKTTTMYQLVKKIAKEKQRQVITIEDPVEIEESYFLQTQVNSSAGISYDSLIRQSLRHHPDIIIVGEIRDELTAHAAIRAALTGHLVVATIHAKNALGVFSRLEELGVSSELLKQTVLAIVFQKMLPRYCNFCKNDCQPSCEKTPLLQKKAVLYDLVYGQKLHKFYSQEQVSDGFNLKLGRAHKDGKISKETADIYYIP